MSAVLPPGFLAAFDEPDARGDLRALFAGRREPPAGAAPARRGPGAVPLVGPPSQQAQAEQREHDRYFQVDRVGGDAARDFVAGLVLAHLAGYENSLSMGVTLLGDAEWGLLFGGLRELSPGVSPTRPLPAAWRDGYDPADRWLVGHQLFFTLIQGVILGLNCFARAVADRDPAEAERGLALAAAFMRSSAAAMKLASDFAPADYDRTVRADMAPPKVRQGFSGLQTRDHAYLVRLFGMLRPAFGAEARQFGGYEDFVESVVSAYAAHEFICARFRGDVLPSLRVAASSRGRAQRPGVEVIREMMRARLALIMPGVPGAPGVAGSRP